MTPYVFRLYCDGARQSRDDELNANARQAFLTAYFSRCKSLGKEQLEKVLIGFDKNQALNDRIMQKLKSIGAKNGN